MFLYAEIARYFPKMPENIQDNYMRGIYYPLRGVMQGYELYIFCENLTMLLIFFELFSVFAKKNVSLQYFLESVRQFIPLLISYVICMLFLRTIVSLLMIFMYCTFYREYTTFSNTVVNNYAKNPAIRRLLRPEMITDYFPLCL